MSDVVLTRQSGAVVTVTVNRPEKLNALNRDVLNALSDVTQTLSTKADVCCVILNGAGEKAFVAGADIAEMKDFASVEARAFAQRGHHVMAAIEALPVPVIASVQGFALGGGCELALACDFIHASSRARFGQPEVKLGVIPGFGGTQRLARRVGIARARELVYSGKMVKAPEALAMGLVNAVHEPEQLAGEVDALAATIASMGPLAVREAKLVLREGEERLLSEANMMEVEAFARCFDTADQKEGMDAFLNKRVAAFKGH